MSKELGDGGGFFGFDVHTALEFDCLIDRYLCDEVIETGSMPATSRSTWRFGGS